MTWTLLAPAMAVVLALMVLTLGLRRLEGEIVALRHALRRSGATAVAADELGRATGRLREHAVELESDARRRLAWPHHPRRLRSGARDR